MELIYEGKYYNIIKYTEYVVEQKNGVRCFTYKTYNEALNNLRILEKSREKKYGT